MLEMSTRSTKCNFSIGERVLCYEPDPTKAKVLYDSKVLDIIVKGNRRGRKQIEYLIHFHRWNHSWDRCVPEELILRDTHENRQLQKELNDKSQLQLKLNRRKAALNAACSSHSGQPNFDDDDTSNPFPGMTDDPDMDPSTTDSDADDEAGADEFPDDSHIGSPDYPSSAHFEAHIEIPPLLKDWLSADYTRVRQEKRLHKLPAEPCVSEILEMAVRDAARAEASAAVAAAGRKSNNVNAGYSLRGPRKAMPAPNNDVIVDLSRRLNLIHEVADGLRIYFDYILGSHLLYKEESSQFLNCDSLRRIVGDDFMSMKRDERLEMELKMYSALAAKHASVNHNSGDELSHSNSNLSKSPTFDNTENAAAAEEAVREGKVARDEGIEKEKLLEVERNDNPGSPVLGRSPKRFKEDKSCIPVTTEVPVTITPADPKRSVKTEIINEPSHISKDNVHASALDNDFENKRIKESGLTSPNPELRRLRSHKTSVSMELSEEITEPKITPEKPCEKIREASPEKFKSPIHSPATPPINTANYILGPVMEMGPAAMTLEEKITNWRIIPEEGCGFYPCKIYGATHLARLFVRLPDFLNATKMDEQKLKSLLSRLQIFTDYLEEHPEWFGECHYFERPANTSRSPSEQPLSPDPVS